MKKPAKSQTIAEFDAERIRRAMKLSAAQRLAFLEKMLRFLDHSMSDRAKRAALALKKAGY